VPVVIKETLVNAKANSERTAIRPPPPTNG
jgi:hypothetical protein